jgi:hypothetical protein
LFSSLTALLSLYKQPLCTCQAHVSQLYCVLKDHEDPPTPEEINITSGKKQLDGHAEAQYLKKLEKASGNIKKAFEDQQAWVAISDFLFQYVYLIW